MEFATISIQVVGDIKTKSLLQMERSIIANQMEVR